MHGPDIQHVEYNYLTLLLCQKLYTWAEEKNNVICNSFGKNWLEGTGNFLPVHGVREQANVISGMSGYHLSAVFVESLRATGGFNTLFFYKNISIRTVYDRFLANLKNVGMMRF